MRLIDTDAFEVVTYKGTETFSDCFDNGVLYMLNKIDKAPTVDAVEVVRCRDCKYWTNYTETDVPYCKQYYGLQGVVLGDDFCSFGERKDRQITSR